jgi:hypothetical protein
MVILFLYCNMEIQQTIPFNETRLNYFHRRRYNPFDFVTQIFNNPSITPNACKIIFDKLKTIRTKCKFYNHIMFCISLPQKNVHIHHQMLCEFGQYQTFAHENIANLNSWYYDDNRYNHYVGRDVLDNIIPYFNTSKICDTMKDALSHIAYVDFITPTNIKTMMKPTKNTSNKMFNINKKLDRLLYDFVLTTDVFKQSNKSMSFYEQFAEYLLNEAEYDYEIFLDFDIYVIYLHKFMVMTSLMKICEDEKENYFENTKEEPLTETEYVFANDYLVYKICGYL